MERISKSHLDGILRRIQRAHGQLPETPLWRKVGGFNVASVGQLFVEEGSRTYGRSWKLCRMCNESGGQSVILYALTARGLYDAMHAYALGFETAQAGLED